MSRSSRRRTSAVVAGLALVASALLAGGAADAASPYGDPADGPFGQVRGRVVDEQGQAVHGCYVTVFRTQPDGGVGGTAETVGDGTFGWVLPAGSYEARAQCYGTGAAPREGVVSFDTTGQAEELGDVVVAPRTIVSGTVTAGGTPLQGVSVWFQGLDIPWAFGGYTQQDGTFRSDLPRGTYQVYARPLTGPYAGQPRAGALTVGPDAVTGVDFALTPGTSVSGVVTAAGQPLTAATVTVHREDDVVFMQNRQVSTDATGAWTAEGLEPGDYTFYVTRWGYPGQQSDRVTVSGTQPVTGVAIDVPLRAQPVSGTVATASGAALTGEALADAWAGDRLVDADWLEQGDTGFSLANIVDGAEYAIGLNRQSGTSLYTGRFYAGAGVLGSATRAGATLVTGSAAAPQALGQVRLDTCSAVSGRVVDQDSWLEGTPYDAVIASVAVFNDADPDLVTRVAPVQPDGTFRVTGLLPGSYYAALRLERHFEMSSSSGWADTEEIFGAADPAQDAPNVVVPADCADVEGVNFGVAPVVAQPQDVVAVTPVRLTDTAAVRGFGKARCTSVVGAGAPAGATGVLVNVASVSPGSDGNVLVFPDDGSPDPTPPAGASVNFEPGRDVANAAFVKVGVGGRICVYSQSFSASRVVVDVSGFTMPDSGVVLQASQRLVDTRPGADHVGELAAALAANTPYEVTVAGRAGVPADAKAVVLNVAAVAPAGSGHLRVYPANGKGAAPDIATVNYAPGRTKSNATVVPLTGGKIGLYSNTFSPTGVDVVLDVTGYVAAGGETYRTVTPERVLDTRPGAPAALRAFATAVSAHVYSFDVRGTAVVPDDATAVVLNVTAIGPNTPGNLRVYPDGDGTGTTPPPAASQINYIPGRDIPNLVVVGVPADGRVNFYSDQWAGGSVDLAVDVVGYTTAVE